jgi:hypothetical protein
VNFIDPWGLDPTPSCDGCSFESVGDPSILRKLATEAAAKGRLSRLLGGAAPSFICDALLKDCKSLNAASGTPEGQCPAGTDLGDFCNQVAAVCSGASKGFSGNAKKALDDGGAGAAAREQGRRSVTDVWARGRGTGGISSRPVTE